MAEAPQDRPDFTRPSPARLRNYWLDGCSSYQPDRDLADELARGCPGLPAAVRAHRALVLKSARWAAAVKGIGQFADLGCGLPSVPSVHRTVQDVNPQARVIYVDRNPDVALECEAARAIEHWEHTAVLRADPADPETVLAMLRAFIDFGRPAGLILGPVLSSMPADAAGDLLAAYTAALAPWSAVISFTVSYADPDLAERQAKIYAGTGVWHNHALEDMEGFFAAAGLKMWQMPPVPGGEQVTVVGGIGFRDDVL